MVTVKGAWRLLRRRHTCRAEDWVGYFLVVVRRARWKCHLRDVMSALGNSRRMTSSKEIYGTVCYVHQSKVRGWWSGGKAPRSLGPGSRKIAFVLVGREAD